MLKIYLTRHGQDLDNLAGILNGRRDQPLSELGWNQAETLAREIKRSGLTFDAIYSSPLQRALTTAEIVATVSASDQPMIIDDLIERDFGTMTAKPISSIPNAFASHLLLKSGIVNYFLEPENGETFPKLLARASSVLSQIKAKHPSGTVLVVTHGDTGKMLYADYYQLPWKDVLLLFHFGNSELLLLSPDSPADQAHVFSVEQFNH